MEEVAYWVVLYLMVGFAVGAGVCCEASRGQHDANPWTVPWFDPKILVLAGTLWPLVGIALLMGLIVGTAYQRKEGTHEPGGDSA